jgi:hypothetical protein
VRKMLGIIMEAVLNLVMDNHFYILGDVIRRQSKGGAIGLRSTGVVARLIMRQFDKLFKLKIIANNILLELYKRYVDDIDICCQMIRLGTKYRNGKLEWREEWKQEDVQIGMKPDRLAMDILQDIGDTIYNFVKLTSDCPSDNVSKYVPILDLQCSIVNNRILHKFYEKPINTRYCILEKSAVGNRTKFTTLVQETVRRMRNCCSRIPEEEKDEIIQKFVLKMRRSGYKGRYRQRVLIAAKGIMDQKRKDDSEGRIPLYRSKEYESRNRRLIKEKKKINWYNGKNTKEKFYMAPLIVDPTPDGKLREELQKICKEHGEEGGMWIKVVERGGDKIKNICRSNPTGSKECGRMTCGICRGDKPGRCNVRGAGYRCKCLECEKEGVKAYYEGESGGNAHNRYLLHEAAVRRGKVEASALAKHMQVQHDGMVGKFTMEVTGTFPGCLERLGDEGIRVRETEEEADIIMNSKTEFHQPPISRVVITRGNRNEDQDDTGRGRGRGGPHRGRGETRGRGRIQG